MSSSVICRLVVRIGTDVSEELSASIISVTRIGELGATLVVANVVLSSQILVRRDDGGAKFLRNVGSYKNHTV
jgi:hypothetical protein